MECAHEPDDVAPFLAGAAPMTLPRFFFDRPVPPGYEQLLDERAVAVGPDDVDLPGAVAVIAGPRRWDAAAMDLGPDLVVISRTGIGYDAVDVVAANERGIVVCNAPEAPSVSTAEHTLALLLAVTKGLPMQQARANVGLGPAANANGLELDGHTLGLVALGRIARRVALAAQAMGMHVIAADPYLTESPLPGVELVGLDDIWRRSDVVSLHAPGTVETRHMVNATTLAAMKQGSYLVNCARGSLVDQDALVASLDGGHLAGAALDVTEPEPLPEGHPLLGRDDVIVTPHIASSTAIGRRRLYEHAITNALAVLAGDLSSKVPECEVTR
jgi:D-3-phosphoglycerate dehydrogenase / 2-oxoglutarate reductase